MTSAADKSRAIRILARSIYKDLEGQGFDEKQIVALATELISEVTTRMSNRDSVTPAPGPKPEPSRVQPPAR